MFREIPIGRTLEVWDGHFAVVAVGGVGVENHMDGAASDQRGRLEPVHGAPKQAGREGDVALLVKLVQSPLAVPGPLVADELARVVEVHGRGEAGGGVAVVVGGKEVLRRCRRGPDILEHVRALLYRSPLWTFRDIVPARGCANRPVSGYNSQ